MPKKDSEKTIHRQQEEDVKETEIIELEKLEQGQEHVKEDEKEKDENFSKQYPG